VEERAGAAPDFSKTGGFPLQRVDTPRTLHYKGRRISSPEGKPLSDEDLDAEEGPITGSADEAEEPEAEGVAAESELPLTDQDRILLVLAYLGILALVPYLTARKMFVLWHARQGLLLFGVSLVSLLGMILANVVLWSFSWVLGLLFLILLLTSLFGVLALVVTCILKAFEGERWRIPFLGDFVERM
jgi:uncharacterized membrane protein